MRISDSDPIYLAFPHVLTALGCGDHFWRELTSGKTGLRPLSEVFPERFPGDERLVGALSLLEGESRLDKVLDCFLSELDDRLLHQADGMFLATSLGDLLGDQAGRPHLVLKRRFSSFKTQVISNACSSGLDALILAVLTLQAKKADVLAVLAVDSLCPAKLAHHIALGTQSTSQARPFDLRRNGTSFGEGAAFVLVANERGLERLKIAPQARVKGFGLTCDGYDIVSPDPSGQFVAEAIRQTGALAPDYVNCHGTGTASNDLAESRGLCASLDLSHTLLSSTKGAIGHALGAIGLIETVICMQALQTNQAPCTYGLESVDPLLGFEPLVQGQAIRQTIQQALSLSLGFGGVNSALLLEKPCC